MLPLVHFYLKAACVETKNKGKIKINGSYKNVTDANDNNNE